MFNKVSKEAADKIRAISVTVPGIVDEADGVARQAYGIWKDPVPVRQILEDALALPVLVRNNVDAFAAAEIFFGAGRKYNSLLVIKWGPGVGSAVVIDGKVYEGRHGKTAELGHYIVKKDGKPCSCGKRGCLETVVSSRAIDGLDEKALQEALDLFARSIVNTMTLIAPHRVILSGSLFRSEKMRREIIAKCRQYDPSIGEDRILHTALSDREYTIGAVAVFVRTFLQIDN